MKRSLGARSHASVFSYGCIRRQPTRNRCEASMSGHGVFSFFLYSFLFQINYATILYCYEFNLYFFIFIRSYLHHVTNHFLISEISFVATSFALRIIFNFFHLHSYYITFHYESFQNCKIFIRNIFHKI